MSFIELVEEVSRKTGLPKAVVHSVLIAFRDTTLERVSSGISVRIPLFGRFAKKVLKDRVLFGRQVKGRTTLKFYTSKELDMEKYAVVMDDEKTKTASEDQKCPKCGGRVIERKDLNVRVCEYCGTEPFEKQSNM